MQLRWLYHPVHPNGIIFIYIYIVYTSFGNLASKTSSHFCKLFFFGKLFQLEVPFGVLSTKRVDSKSATFSCLGAEEVRSFIANWHSVPMLKNRR